MGIAVRVHSPHHAWNARMPMAKVRPIVKVEDVVLTSEGYHVYYLCTYDERSHKVASVQRRFSDFSKLDTVLQKSIKVSTTLTLILKPKPYSLKPTA